MLVKQIDSNLHVALVWYKMRNIVYVIRTIIGGTFLNIVYMIMTNAKLLEIGDGILT